MKYKYIAIEGIDGSGKQQLQICYIMNYLKSIIR